MKHSPIDANISQARRASMEAADRLRSSERRTDQSNIVIQQNCLTAQEVTSDSDSVKTIQTGSANSKIKLPATSVRHMQQRSKSMTFDNTETKSHSPQNRVPETIRNGEPEIKNPALRRSHSTTAVSCNKENANLPVDRSRLVYHFLTSGIFHSV